MDKKLNALWKEAQYPFDQITYKLDDLIRLDALHKSLIHIVEFLRNNFSKENTHERTRHGERNGRRWQYFE